jgi:hypothetical protein
MDSDVVDVILKRQLKLEVRVCEMESQWIMRGVLSQCFRGGLVRLLQYETNNDIFENDKWQAAAAFEREKKGAQERQYNLSYVIVSYVFVVYSQEQWFGLIRSIHEKYKFTCDILLASTLFREVDFVVCRLADEWMALIIGWLVAGMVRGTHLSDTSFLLIMMIIHVVLVNHFGLVDKTGDSVPRTIAEFRQLDCILVISQAVSQPTRQISEIRLWLKRKNTAKQLDILVHDG